jgi:hypothetical protein
MFQKYLNCTISFNSCFPISNIYQSIFGSIVVAQDQFECMISHICNSCLRFLHDIFFLNKVPLFFFRTSRSEFIVSLNKYLEVRNHKLSVGMRFKMRFEGEEVPERRYYLILN